MSFTFERLSAKAAADFIQTVVVVDNEARFEPVPTPSKLTTPPEVIQAEAVEAAQLPAGTPIGHPLDARILSDEFAAHGIVAHVMQPVTGEAESSFDSAVIQTCSRVDVVVVDWHLGDDGERATTLIRRLLGSDKQQRLRLLAVYTGDPDLKAVASRLRDALHLQLDESQCLLTSETVRVIVLAKGGTKVPGDVQKLVATERELPDRLILEFARHSPGLLSNLVLAYLAAVRNNTHRVISLFPPSLDAPYLADRAAQSIPTDAEDLAIDLVAQALGGVVEARKLRRFVDLDAISAWLRIQEALGTSFAVPAEGAQNAVPVDRTLLIQLMRNGRLETQGPNVSKRRWAEAPSLTAVWCGAANHEHLDHAFAEMIGLARTFTSPETGRIPELRMGTLVAKPGRSTTKDEYYVCIQPVCDSVRLDGPRDFIFLPIAVLADKQFIDFDLAFQRLDGNPVTGEVGLRPYDVVSFRFAPTAASKLVAGRRRRLRGRAYRAFREQSGSQLYWLGDLRDEQAQRIIHSFTTRASRIGLAESEWARTAQHKRFS
ncbi:MAG TPA: hypothetical protein DEV93_04425 [Chloroflexi bacterium]|nr:hypothetical protein [Chloroflexota bacterium]